MKVQEILCWYMWAKHYRLEELGNTIPYFTKKDEKGILLINDRIAKKIYDYLIEYLSKSFKGEISFGNDGNTCIPCILTKFLTKYKSCNNCFYLKNHGCCPENNSDYLKIKNLLNSLYPFGTCSSLNIMIGKSYFEWILEEITEMYNNKNSYEFIKSK